MFCPVRTSLQFAYHNLNNMATTNSNTASAQNTSDPDTDTFSKVTTTSEVSIPAPPIKEVKNAVLQKCLHPPTAVPDFCGMPTNEDRDQLVMQFQRLDMLKQPMVVQGSTARPVANYTGNQSWLLLNSAKIMAFAFIREDSTTGPTTWKQDLANTIYNDAYDFENFSKDTQLFRPCYKSTTWTLNATAFNDVGMVCGAQFNPAVGFQGPYSKLANEDPVLFVDSVCYKIQQGHVLILHEDDEDYQSWKDKERHFPRFALLDLKFKLGLTNEALTIEPWMRVQFLSLGEAPGLQIPVPSISNLLQSTPRSLCLKAKEGVFMVQRINTVAPQWINSFGGNAPSLAQYECALYWESSTDQQRHFSFLNEVNDSGSVDVVFDTAWTKDMTMGWITSEGLMPNVGGNGTPTLPITVSALSNIAIKTYYGLEIQPALVSPFNTLTKQSPQPDLMTMQTLLRQFYEIKDAMPARMNFLGLLNTGLKLLGPVIDAFAGGSSKEEAPKLAKRAAVKAEAEAEVAESMAQMSLKDDRVPARRPFRKAGFGINDGPRNVQQQRYEPRGGSRGRGGGGGRGRGGRGGGGRRRGSRRRSRSGSRSRGNSRGNSQQRQYRLPPPPQFR